MLRSWEETLMKFSPINSMAKRRKKTIHERYREILKESKLSDEEIDKMRVYIRLLALAIAEHVLKSKISEIY